jgi:hypothetical protein
VKGTPKEQEMRRYSKPPVDVLASLFGIHDAKLKAILVAKVFGDFAKVEKLRKALDYLDWRIDDNLKLAGLIA